MGDLDSIPGLGRSPGEGNGFPLQYSGLKNPMDTMEQPSQKLRGMFYSQIFRTWSQEAAS